jgi:hypothetical protein
MLSVMQIDVMLRAAFFNCYAECRYAECHCADVMAPMKLTTSAISGSFLSNKQKISWKFLPPGGSINFQLIKNFKKCKF